MEVPGSIKCVSCRDFMIFEKLKYNPTCNINFIVGPNGAGKSSIFCAIVLGLGGKTNVIKRADKISSFIKYGCQRACIEIELYNNRGDNYIIQREINRDNSTRCSLNGKIVTSKVIDDLVKKLNIQLDNLCQFLPQDRVADFAKMKQIDLLENTIKASGLLDLFNLHILLKESTALLQSKNLKIKSLKKLLENESQKNSDFKNKITYYLEMKKQHDKIHSIKKKKVLIEYHEANMEVTDFKDMLNGLKMERSNLEKLKEPYDKKLEHLNFLCNLTSNQKTNSQSTINLIYQRILEKNEMIKSNLFKVSDIYQGLEIKKQNESERILKLLDAQCQLERKNIAYQNLLEDKPAVEFHMFIKDEKINELNDKIGDIKCKIANITKEIQLQSEDIMRDESILANMLDRGQTKLEILKNMNRDTFEAVVWLREHSGLFLKTIHEPLLLVLEVLEISDAKYLENVINSKDMFAFICEDPGDLNIFLHYLRDIKKLKLNCVMAPCKDLSFFQPRIEINEILRWGFDKYVLDMIHVPLPVLAYLCQQYDVHNIPIGNQMSDDYIDEMFDLGFKRIYTQNMVYTIKISKYEDHARSIYNQEIKEPFLLKESVSKHQTQTQRKLIASGIHCKDKHQRLKSRWEEELFELQRNQRMVISEKNKLNEKSSEIRGSELDMTQMERQITQLNKQKLDLELEEKKAQRSLEAVFNNHLALLQDLTTMIRQGLQVSKTAMRLGYYLAFLKSNKSLIEQESKIYFYKLDDLNEKIIEISKTLKRKGIETSKLLSDAENIIGVDLRKPLPPELTREISAFPSDYSELEHLLYEEQCKEEYFLETNEDNVEEFTKHQENISSMESKIKELGSKIAKIEQKTEEDKKSWLCQLESLIRKINKQFDKFMRFLGCAGEVVLIKGEYVEEYGVCIRSKFREDQGLLDLTSGNLSGGERSVVTVLYLLALQAIAPGLVPFRCLDEINQGMDPFNERRIYHLLGSFGISKSTQYFIITPKLLPSIPYAPTTTVTVVSTGDQTISGISPKTELQYLLRAANLDRL